jgi:hypothetical protein
MKTKFKKLFKIGDLVEFVTIGIQGKITYIDGPQGCYEGGYTYHIGHVGMTGLHRGKPQIIKLHSPDCPECHQRGYAVFTCIGSQHIPEGALAVQKCDTCEVFKTDTAAAKAALKAGVPCDAKWPHVVKPKDAPAWTANKYLRFLGRVDKP